MEARLRGLCRSISAGAGLERASASMPRNQRRMLMGAGSRTPSRRSCVGEVEGGGQGFTPRRERLAVHDAPGRASRAPGEVPGHDGELGAQVALFRRRTLQRGQPGRLNMIVGLRLIAHQAMRQRMDLVGVLQQSCVSGALAMQVVQGGVGSIAGADPPGPSHPSPAESRRDARIPGESRSCPAGRLAGELRAILTPASSMLADWPSAELAARR